MVKKIKTKTYKVTFAGVSTKFPNKSSALKWKRALEKQIKKSSSPKRKVTLR